MGVDRMCKGIAMSSKSSVEGKPCFEGKHLEMEKFAVAGLGEAKPAWIPRTKWWAPQAT